MRLIDADTLKEKSECTTDPMNTYQDMCFVRVTEIDDAPTVDSVPVAHGKWKMNSDYPDALICSNCDSKYDVIWMDCGSNYCPHCGAKMEE